MSDVDLEAEVSFLRELFVPTPEGAATLDEVVDGFTPERARAVLESEELFEHLVELTQGVAPGLGWVQQAIEEGGATRRLLQRVLAERPDEDTVALPIVHSAAGLRVGPPSLLDADERDLARVKLPGGWLGWSPVELHSPPMVHLDRPQQGIPAWVADLAGDRLAEDLRQGGPSSTWDALLDEPHPVSRYALGCWLEEHSPTEVSLPVLRLELGALAHEFADLLPGVAEAWLRPLGDALLRLHAQIRTWDQRERAGAEPTLEAMRSAFLAACPDAPGADTVAKIHAIQWPDLSRSDYALAAGGEGFDGSSAPESLLTAVADRRAAAVVHYLAYPEPDTYDPARPFLAELLAHHDRTHAPDE